MNQAKKYKLMDLIEDIKKVDDMISLHSTNTSTFMLEQYKIKKAKLISYLIDELVEPDLRSAKSFAIIQKLIKRFYPNLKKEAQADVNHQDLNELEAVLV